jgi:hypothetical protein
MEKLSSFTIPLHLLNNECCQLFIFFFGILSIKHAILFVAQSDTTKAILTTQAFDTVVATIAQSAQIGGYAVVGARAGA